VLDNGVFDDGYDDSQVIYPLATWQEQRPEEDTLATVPTILDEVPR